MKIAKKQQFLVRRSCLRKPNFRFLFKKNHNYVIVHLSGVSSVKCKVQCCRHFVRIRKVSLKAHCVMAYIDKRTHRYILVWI